MATTSVYPRLFEVSITLTFRAGYLKRVIGTATVYSRWLELLINLTFRALHGQSATLRESRVGRLPTLVWDFITLTL